MLRLGIIGSGFGLYGLLPAFRSVRGCKVICLCGRKRPQLVAYCKKIGFTNIYADWKQMLKQEDLDAIAIAVTPNAQVEIAMAAMKQGLHVFAEKPLASTVAQAKALVRLARRKKIVHGMDFLFPEIAEWQRVKTLLDQKKLGEFKHLAVDWDFLSYDIAKQHSSWKTDVQKGGGALAFFFSHGLQYIEHFAGPLKAMKTSFVHAAESGHGGEVGIDMRLTFQTGVTGCVHVSCNHPSLFRHQLVFECEKGRIVLSNTKDVVSSFSVTVIRGTKKKRLSVSKDRDHPSEDERVKVVRKLAGRFVRCCIAKKQMTPSFLDGLRVQELIALARSDAKQAGR